MMTGTAFAQTPAKQPVIDSAPPRVNYRGGGVIAGSLASMLASSTG